MKRKIITDAAVSKKGSSYKGREGILILDEKDHVLHFSSAALGTVTSNEGEYLAMQHGVEEVITSIRKELYEKGGVKNLANQFTNEFKAVSLEVFTDSQLVFNQMLGNYKTKKKSLVQVKSLITALCKPFKETKVKWHRRDRDLAVLADFASKHPRRTKAMFLKMKGEHYDKFMTRAVALLIKDDDNAKLKAAREKDDANISDTQ